MLLGGVFKAADSHNRLPPLP